MSPCVGEHVTFIIANLIQAKIRELISVFSGSNLSRDTNSLSPLRKKRIKLLSIDFKAFKLIMTVYTT